MSESIYRAHNVSRLMYHFVFPTKYRRVVIDGNVDNVIKETCKENDFGFCMSRNDVYGMAVNEYEEAMEILEKCMSAEAYEKLVLTSVE